MQLLKILKPFINNKKISSVLSHRSLKTTSSDCFLQKKLGRYVSSLEKEKHLKQLDRVSESHQLIYYMPMESYISWSVHTSTLTASLIALAAIYQYTYNLHVLESTQFTLILEKEDIYYFAVGFITINALVRWIISKVPLRIYKIKNQYLAIYNKQLPGLRPQHHFKRGEVKKVDFILNPWNNATYKLGNQTCLILPDYFKTPFEFHQMFDSEKNKY
uniref:Transmembrane protein 186 n=1 Tax=Glossina austeni TaxID=7395 RepID=A0A1A9VT73_GLOAU